MTEVFRNTPETVARAVIEILAAQALRDPASIARDAEVEALGIDSLGMAEVIFAIEERFDVAVPFDGAAPEGREAIDLRSVGGVIAAVQALLAQPAGAASAPAA